MPLPFHSMPIGALAAGVSVATKPSAAAATARRGGNRRTVNILIYGVNTDRAY